MARSPVANLLAHQFMEAMMHKDWSDMWSMLHPDAQQAWQGEKDFVHFEQVKFGALKFTAYKDTAARIQSSWLDPNNTLTYPKAQTLRISLQATAPKGLLTEPSNAALEKGLFDNTLFAVAPYHQQWRVLVAGPADLEAPILVPTSPPAIKLLVPIFMYHHISNKPTQNLLDYGLTVRTVDFDEQLTWLQKQGYHSITQTELFDALYYGKILPPHPMILTFDDGYEDAYTDALPVLLAHHYRGVFYIITGMIGGRYMLWDQIRILVRDGMQISSHTVHHVNVGEPPYGTSTQFELTVAKSTLEKELGKPIQFFCYPSGEPFHHDTVAEQQVVLADLFADGYVSATLDPFWYNSAIQDAQMPYELNRIRVSGGESLDAFIGIFNYTMKTGATQLEQG
jgi:peptidoglycan/xylan/chitin deacetylase (PgdA/CDA1 family)